MVQSQRGALPALKHVVCFDPDGSKAHHGVVDYAALLSAANISPEIGAEHINAITTASAIVNNFFLM